MTKRQSRFDTELSPHGAMGHKKAHLLSSLNVQFDRPVGLRQLDVDKVEPLRSNEFVCNACHLVKHKAQNVALDVCVDCC